MIYFLFFFFAQPAQPLPIFFILSNTFFSHKNGIGRKFFNFFSLVLFFIIILTFLSSVICENYTEGIWCMHHILSISSVTEWEHKFHWVSFCATDIILFFFPPLRQHIHTLHHATTLLFCSHSTSVFYRAHKFAFIFFEKIFCWRRDEKLFFSKINFLLNYFDLVEGRWHLVNKKFHKYFFCHSEIFFLLWYGHNT